MNISLITIIVPIYKVEAYLDRCVQSIVDQTYTNLEILLVDDGSPDNCPTMCDAWAAKDNRIKVIHKANGGLSDARNAGLGAATGEYIAFVDGDDWIAPEMLERLYEAIQRDGSDIAACSVEMVWEDDTPSRMLTVRKNQVLERAEAQAELLLEKMLKQPVWYKLYRRETIQGILFEVGKYHEDVFWSYQAVGKAKRVSLIDYVGYFYTQRPGSIMGESFSLKRLDAMEAYERRYGYLKNNFPSLEQNARLSIHSKCIYMGQMSQLFMDRTEQKAVFKYLREVQKRYPICHKDYAGRKLSHRLWFDIARISLPFACYVKNWLHVGL